MPRVLSVATVSCSPDTPLTLAISLPVLFPSPAQLRFYRPRTGDRLTRDELLARLAGLRQAPIDRTPTASWPATQIQICPEHCGSSAAANRAAARVVMAPAATVRRLRGNALCRISQAASAETSASSAELILVTSGSSGATPGRGSSSPRRPPRLASSRIRVDGDRFRQWLLSRGSRRAGRPAPRRRGPGCAPLPRSRARRRSPRSPDGIERPGDHESCGQMSTRYAARCPRIMRPSDHHDRLAGPYL